MAHPVWKYSDCSMLIVEAMQIQSLRMWWKFQHSWSWPLRNQQVEWAFNHTAVIQKVLTLVKLMILPLLSWEIWQQFFSWTINSLSALSQIPYMQQFVFMMATIQIITQRLPVIIGSHWDERKTVASPIPWDPLSNLLRDVPMLFITAESLQKKKAELWGKLASEIEQGSS